MLYLQELLARLPRNADDAFQVACEDIEEFIEKNGEVTTGHEDALLLHFILRLHSKVSSVEFEFGQNLNALEKLKEFLGWGKTQRLDRQIEQFFGEIDDIDAGFDRAELDADDKRMIHEKLEEIRTCVESSGLTVRKKNALFKRLAALHLEVDLVATSTDRFFAFMGDLAFNTGDNSEKGKPAIDAFKDIMNLLGARRAKSDGVALPSPDELLKIGSGKDGEAE
jgi:hypothetical protein